VLEIEFFDSISNETLTFHLFLQIEYFQIEHYCIVTDEEKIQISVLHGQTWA